MTGFGKGCRRCDGEGPGFGSSCYVLMISSFAISWESGRMEEGGLENFREDRRPLGTTTPALFRKDEDCE
ncbi:hypothetical protein TNCV_1975171 [Trichonephila clavipes]|nr:hypothetical protein TNCV_1975171 [Trichonephila clavipes]